MELCIGARIQIFGGCATGIGDGILRKESTGVKDWQAAQKKLRERLHARDGNILEIVRKGEALDFGQWADIFLENYSKPPIRELKTHNANQSGDKASLTCFWSPQADRRNADDIELLPSRTPTSACSKQKRKWVPRKRPVKPATVHQELRVLRRMLNVAVRKRLLPSNPCSSVEFPVVIKGLFKPHYVTWSEQQRIERQSPQFLRNIVRILTETGLRMNKELLSMRKDQVDIANATVWIPDSKTENGVAEVPLTPIAVDAFRNQLALAGQGDWLFPSHRTRANITSPPRGIWREHSARAGVSYFRIYDLRSTYATRLSAGGVADEWVVQLLRQGEL